MNYQLLQKMGLGNIDITYLFLVMLILLLIFMIMTIILLVKTNKLIKKYKRFMKGENAKSLENDIIEMFERQVEIEETLSKNSEDIKLLYKKFKKAFQKVSLTKYDAFNQMGGKLSFCLALLDENNNGFILNSVHSAEGCYSYTKEIINGESSISLGEEEKQALLKAMNVTE